MEVDMTFVEVSLSSETAKEKPKFVYKSGPASQKKINLKARVEVFAAACQGASRTAHRLSGGAHRLHQHNTQSHCSADAAAIEAILLGLQLEPAPLACNPHSSMDSNNNSSSIVAMPPTAHSRGSNAGLASLDEGPIVPDSFLSETWETLPARPAAQSQAKSKLLQYFSKVTSKCQAAAAALPTARPNRDAVHADTDSRRSSDSSVEGAMGEDACPYKFAFPKPPTGRSSWLLGMKKEKARKQQQGARSSQDTAAPAATATVISAPCSSRDPTAGNTGSEMGEDPCPHKITLPRPLKSSRLLGMSGKSSRQHKGAPAASNAAPKAAAASSSRTVSKRCRNAWSSFCSRLQSKPSQGGAVV